MRSRTVLDAHGSQFLTEDSGEFPRPHYKMDYSIFFLHREKLTGSTMEVYSPVNGECALRSKFVTREVRMRLVR
jgi:hypothetical protein